MEFDRPVGLFAFLGLEEQLGQFAGRRVDLVSRRALKADIGRRILAKAIRLQPGEYGYR